MNSLRWTKMVGPVSVVVVLMGCTGEGEIRGEVARTLDDSSDDDVAGVCQSMMSMAKGSSNDEAQARSRDAFEAATGGPDVDLAYLGDMVDSPAVPTGVSDYSSSEIHEWLLATWDECVERDEI